MKKNSMTKLIFTIFLLLVSILNAFGQDEYLEKGNNFLSSGQLDKAEQTFKDGIKANPDNLIYRCQLGLTLIQQAKYEDSEKVLNDVLRVDSNNVAAIWYSGIGNSYAGLHRQAISRFEKALTFLNENSGQYFSAHWFIGQSYSKLLMTEGLTFEETDRMFECYEEYLQLQPDADDAEEIREYVERKKKRRPPRNVKTWVDM